MSSTRRVLLFAAALVSLTLLLVVTQGGGIADDDVTVPAATPGSQQSIRVDIPAIPVAPASTQPKRVSSFRSLDPSSSPSRSGRQGADGAGQAVGADAVRGPLDEFVSDPSLSIRCKLPLFPPNRAPGGGGPSCPRLTSTHFTRNATAVLPLLAPQLVPGQPTTRGMTVVSMASVGGSGSAQTWEHHPIFIEFVRDAGRYQAPLLRDRLFEFTGSHANVTYDCGRDVDFRLYHQVRAAACEEHEHALRHQPGAPFRGVVPLVDEEYFEFIMTLMTSRAAARAGKSYTFFEFGARYGTWAARAGAAFRAWRQAQDGSADSHLGPTGSSSSSSLATITTDDHLRLRLVAVEGSCLWYRAMQEHMGCNHLDRYSELIMAYVAPRSYNQVDVKQPLTYAKARAVSLLDLLPTVEANSFVDMIDFDIQGFEALTMEEPGVMQLCNDKVGFIHFGTHSTDVEWRLIRLLVKHKWQAVYFFAGAHTKKLNRGHRCRTPFGPSLFNDGAAGFANPKFHGNLSVDASWVPASVKATAALCYAHPQSASTWLT